jgi:hypothetical protein
MKKKSNAMCFDLMNDEDIKTARKPFPPLLIARPQIEFIILPRTRGVCAFRSFFVTLCGENYLASLRMLESFLSSSSHSSVEIRSNYLSYRHAASVF